MNMEDLIEALARQSFDRPIRGSQENPYDLYVPDWMETLAHTEDTTCQEIANRIFNAHVTVTVVEAL